MSLRLNQQHSMLAALRTKKMNAEEAQTVSGVYGGWRRVSELAYQGYITPALDKHGDRLYRKTSNGVKSQVWEITTDGREALKDWNAQAKKVSA